MDLVVVLVVFVVLIVLAVVTLRHRGQIGTQHGDRGQADRTSGEVSAREAEMLRRGGRE